MHDLTSFWLNICIDTGVKEWYSCRYIVGGFMQNKESFGQIFDPNLLYNELNTKFQQLKDLINEKNDQTNEKLQAIHDKFQIVNDKFQIVNDKIHAVSDEIHKTDKAINEKITDLTISTNSVKTKIGIAIGLIVFFVPIAVSIMDRFL